MLELYENEKKLLRVCLDLKLKGIRVDTDYINYQVAECKRADHLARQRFFSDTGHEYLESAKLFAKIFDARQEWYPRTPKGNPSFKASFLETLTSPTARLINEVRGVNKLLSTFYLPFLKFAKEGVIHPNLNQAGTATGRFSSSRPNMQQIPSDPVVRRCFVPRHGHFLASIDFKQLEFAVMLDYAGSSELIAKVNEGHDLHQATADLIGIDRKTAKTVNFAILYGVGVVKLGEMLGISVERSRRLRNLYLRALPEVNLLIKNVARTAERRGYVVNWLGRRCHLTKKEMSYKMTNHLIQGGAADILKKGMVDIHEKYPGYMLLNIHDELLFEIPFGKEHLIREFQSILEAVYPSKNGVVLKTDVEVSEKSWGDMKAYEGNPVREEMHRRTQVAPAELLASESSI